MSALKIIQLNIMRKFVAFPHLFRSLLMRDRKPIEVHNVKHQWKEYDPDDFIKPNEVSAEKHIFPIHGTLKILKMDGATKKRLMDNCKSLYRM